MDVGGILVWLRNCHATLPRHALSFCRLFGRVNLQVPSLHIGRQEEQSISCTPHDGAHAKSWGLRMIRLEPKKVETKPFLTGWWLGHPSEEYESQLG